MHVFHLLIEMLPSILIRFLRKSMREIKMRISQSMHHSHQIGAEQAEEVMSMPQHLDICEKFERRRRVLISSHGERQLQLRVVVTGTDHLDGCRKKALELAHSGAVITRWETTKITNSQPIGKAKINYSSR